MSNLPKNYTYTVTLSMNNMTGETSDLNKQELLNVFENLVGDFSASRGALSLIVTDLTQQ
jgi:hypothetical protein